MNAVASVLMVLGMWELTIADGRFPVADQARRIVVDGKGQVSVYGAWKMSMAQ